MFSIERQNEIRKMIEKNGGVRTEELIKKFSVSSESIRRDFIALENLGILRRVYGGAVGIGKTVLSKSLDARMDEFRDKKINLAQCASQYVSDGDIISIDEGSSALEFATVLARSFENLTVFTNSLDVLDVLKGTGNKTILCGGIYSESENAFYGEMTADAYESHHVSKTFLFPSAVSLLFGITDADERFLRIKKAMMHSCDKVYIPADSSKFEVAATFKLCDLNPAFTYITDNEIPASIVSLYKENGIILNNK